MDVDGDSMTKSLLELGYHQVRVTIKYFEVADSVLAEERAGYGSMEPGKELVRLSRAPQ